MHAATAYSFPCKRLLQHSSRQLTMQCLLPLVDQLPEDQKFTRPARLANFAQGIVGSYGICVGCLYVFLSVWSGSSSLLPQHSQQSLNAAGASEVSSIAASDAFSAVAGPVPRLMNAML